MAEGLTVNALIEERRSGGRPTVAAADAMVVRAASC